MGAKKLLIQAPPVEKRKLPWLKVAAGLLAAVVVSWLTLVAIEFSASKARLKLTADYQQQRAYYLQEAGTPLIQWWLYEVD